MALGRGNEHGPKRGQIVAQTERLDLYVGAKTFSAEQVAELAPRIERALQLAERHFGTTLKYRVSVGFYRKPPQKGVRGMAYTDEARAELGITDALLRLSVGLEAESDLIADLAFGLSQA